MRKVKYCVNKLYDNNVDLTIGNIYDVIKYRSSKYGEYYDIITILNDNEIVENYYVMDSNEVRIFQDVSTEYRDNAIDNILE